jgi:hypothetical protein
MGIDLHIEELVLHGFAACDRHKIAEAVQIELTRLLSAQAPQSLLSTPLAFERMNGGVFNIKAGAKPQATGKQIARAVFRGLRQQAKAASSPPARSIIGDSHS